MTVKNISNTEGGWLSMRSFLKKRGKKWYIVINEKNANGTWKKRYISTGTEDKKVAERKMVEYEHQINVGSYVTPDKMNLKDLLELWMKEYVEVNCEKTTWAGYETVLRNHMIPFLGHIPIQKLTAMDIQRYYNHLLKEGRFDGKGGLSPNTVRKHHANLHHVLDYALKMGLLSQNVTKRVTPPKIKKFKAGCYTESQVKKLFDTAKGFRIEVAIHLAASLGLRRSEICGLRWKDIDFKKGTITVAQVNVQFNGKINFIKDPKSEAGFRKQTASLSLLALLKQVRIKQKEDKLRLGQYYVESDRVLRNEDGSIIKPARLSHIFESFISKNKLPKIRLHDLRHTYATILLKHGVAYKAVQERMGHSDIGILFNTYGHVIDEMELQGAKEIDAAFYNVHS